MKPKFSLSLVVALLLYSTAVWAQLGSGSSQDIASIKSQSLVVILKDEDPKELKKLVDKPNDLATYQGYIANYNTQLQELVSRMWKFSPSVEFRHAAELPALRKAKGAQHGVLQQEVLVEEHWRYTIGGPAPGGRNNLANYRYSSDRISTFTLSLYGDGSQRRIWSVSIAPGPVYTSDIIFCLGNMQTYMQERLDGRNNKDVRAEIAENGKMLPAKTLLIDEVELKRGNLTAAEIKEVYPFPYQIVSRLTIEQAVASADARYAYIRMWPMTETLMMQITVDAATSKLLGYHNGYGGVSRASLKDFAKIASK